MLSIPPLKILHLEAHATDRTKVQDLLKASGILHKYTFAVNEKEFVHHLENNTQDLVLSDYHLPEYSGISALRRVRTLDLGLPFIFVAHPKTEDSAAQATLQSANDFVLKSMPEHLIPAIQRVVREQQHESQHRNALLTIKEKGLLIKIQKQQYNSIYNKLKLQNQEKDQRESELVLANIELAFQNQEKENRAAELLLANKELGFQNSEKEKRAQELILANIELAFQNEEKGNRAAELILANKELAYQNSEKEKRAEELALSGIQTLIAEEQFRLVVESTPNAIVLVTEEGTISLINQKTELLFGYERKDLLGQNLELLLPGRFQSSFIKHKNEFSNDPRSKYLNQGNNLFAMRKNGTEIMVEVGLNQLQTTKGQMVLATIIDITERKIQEIRLKKHNRELLTQNKEKELRAAELVIANEELVFQNSEKEKRAAELVIANHELLYQNKEREKRATELITANIQKNEEAKIRLILEAKNKNITDSIYYAKRIQMAKLPKKEVIYAALTDCFILFKPKDIVSGDFYFFHNTPDTVYIVAADCTGHGVPGAFMSMIGTDKLTEAFSTTSDPSAILKFLNRGVKSALHQSESRESTRDGMDIAICAIHKETNLIRYSGANRPIWMIAQNSKEIIEVKATKKAIGGFTHNDQDFISHNIQMNKGDTFYIFTDGYADQFGGRAGKKLMTKKFKEILLSIQHKSMKEQEVHLTNFIELWRAENEQVDDILVIGVRI